MNILCYDVPVGTIILRVPKGSLQIIKYYIRIGDWVLKNQCYACTNVRMCVFACVCLKICMYVHMHICMYAYTTQDVVKYWIWKRRYIGITVKSKETSSQSEIATYVCIMHQLVLAAVSSNTCSQMCVQIKHTYMQDVIHTLAGIK